MHEPVVKYFSPIRLDEMDRVKLMKRTDTKYWFHASRLQNILQQIEDQYYVLEIDGQEKLPYATTYFDTDADKMYSTHHNGKLNRYKVRRRTYLSSGISFLEVKFKSNKGKTLKTRINTNDGHIELNQEENAFLEQLIPFNCKHLSPSLMNNFSRLTLVNKNFQERCTIDINLRFKTAQKQVSLDDLTIVEIKSDGRPTNSPLARALRDERIKSSGFSKYCVGRAVTDPSLKQNAFKEKIRSIEKTIQKKINV